MSKNARMAAVAWLLAAVYYFYQYMLRSSPSVMMTPAVGSFGLSASGSSLNGGTFLLWLFAVQSGCRCRYGSSGTKKSYSPWGNCCWNWCTAFQYRKPDMQEV